MATFLESRYDAAQLRRNRVLIALITLGGVGACMIGGATTSWPWGNAIATSVVVLVFGGCLWWLFASRKAGPVKLSETSIDLLKRTFWKP